MLVFSGKKKITLEENDVYSFSFPKEERERERESEGMSSRQTKEPETKERLDVLRLLPVHPSLRFQITLYDIRDIVNNLTEKVKKIDKEDKAKARDETWDMTQQVADITKFLDITVSTREKLARGAKDVQVSQALSQSIQRLSEELDRLRRDLSGELTMAEPYPSNDSILREFEAS